MSPENMTSLERRAVVSLASIMSLRMIGLFMVLPVFTLYATHLTGATPMLVGLSLGIYGLFQALFQIPLGALSDQFGRKPIIFIGLTIFAIGSLFAFTADSIGTMIFGRALQGAGAIGSIVLALLADLTRETQRTKSMAIAGMSIGFSFALAMLLGPMLTKWVPVNDLFLLAMLFGVVAVFILFTFVPTPETIRLENNKQSKFKTFYELLKMPELAKLNSGIFLLHTIFTASFVVIPISLYRFQGITADQQWLLYLPTLGIAFISSLFCIGIAERKHQIKFWFLSSILVLGTSEILFWVGATNLFMVTIALSCFFVGFSLLEAFLPSLISRTAPASHKGIALGIYSCSQFLGIFVGGVLGGWLYGKFDFAFVYCICFVLAFIWFFIAIFMQPPRRLVTQIVKLQSQQHQQWEKIATKLQLIPGMIELTFIEEDGIAYLKMEQNTTDHPDFIRLKEQLQLN